MFTVRAILGLNNALDLSDAKHRGELFVAIDRFLKEGKHLGETTTFAFKPFDGSTYMSNERGKHLSHPFYDVSYLPARKQGLLIYIG